jgi:hypothetical protein
MSANKRVRLPEPERIEHGYLTPQPGTAHVWRSWNSRHQSEQCDGDVSCYATQHDDLCLARNDPFRSDNRPTWQWEEMA